MLGTLIWKELLEHLRGLRFVVGFLATVGLFVLGAAVWNVRVTDERASYRTGMEAYEEAIRTNAEKSLSSLFHTRLDVWLPPSSLTFASGGYGRDLPNVAAIWHRLYVRSFEQRGIRNPVLVRVEPDWVFIVGTLGSLIALLLTYDAIAGEKERGALRLLLANRVPRDSVLLAKYVAALAMAGLPILVGAVSACTIVQVAGAGLPPGAWPALGGVFLVALLYLSAFVWLGLLASTRTHSSSLALFSGLVVWALLAVFVPHAGILVGDALVDVPSASEADHAVWSSKGVSDEETRRIQDRARRDYADRLLRQVDVARQFTLVSPTAALGQAAEALTITGVVRYRAFVDQTFAYRGEFTSFVHRKDAEDPDTSDRTEAGHMGTYSAKPVAPEEVPRFHFTEPSLAQRLDLALPAILVLLAANLVCFLGAYLSFRRYDVR